MPNALNGGTTQLLLWIANGLLTIVMFLLGIVVKMHVDSDKERKDQHDKDVKDLQTQTSKDLDVHTKELEKLRERMHNHGNRVAEIITRMRWQEEDKTKGGN